MCLLGAELDSLKRRESTNYDLEVMTRKVADAQGDITDIVTGLLRDIVSSYDSIVTEVDGVFVAISRRLKEAFNRGARCLKQSVRDGVRAGSGRNWRIVC